jgi:hypothetical protein
MMMMPKKQASEESMKKKVLQILKMSAERRANDFYEAEVDNIDDPFIAFTVRTEELIKDLEVIKNQVEPCFPPSYEIFNLHFKAYQKLVNERLTDILKNPKNEKIFNEDPRLILEFSNCISNCDLFIYETLKCNDKFFTDTIY